MTRPLIPLFLATAMLAAADDPVLLDAAFTAGGSATASDEEENAITLLSETGLPFVAQVATAEGAVHFPGRLGRVMEIDNVKAELKTIGEETTAFIAPVVRFTDGTKLMEPTAVIQWSVIDGPVESVEDGNVMAAAVYEDSVATIGGTVNGLLFDIQLSVVENRPDNFGYYSGDSLSDLWQVQTFGISNPLGHGTQDPDSDGQNNLFEYTAGLDPKNNASKFHLSLAPEPGGGMRLVFHPRFADRSYIVWSSTTLDAANWMPLSGAMISDDGIERTVIDTQALGGRKFYRVEISQP